MNSTYSIRVNDTPDPQDVNLVRQGLYEYNCTFAPDGGFRPLTIFLRDSDGKLVGGLLGGTYWGWLHVDILWLDESVRRQGYGQQMMAMAEQEALQRGCHHAHLDTMSFQARGFYEKLGYEVFGVLDDLPKGHSRIFLKKELQPA